MREGTKDITELFPAIAETWQRKGIRQKIHYSEPTLTAITPKHRRKHSPRVATLTPCPNDVDLMIEAKDKEQAVFEVMKTFKLPGFEKFNDITPHVRNDDNKPVKAAAKKTPQKKGKKAKTEDELEAMDEALEELEEQGPTEVLEEEAGMGGPDRRAYWPPGMEEWLRPAKRVAKKKDESVEGKTKIMQAKKEKSIEVLRNDIEAENGTGKDAKAPPVKRPAVKRTVNTRKKAIKLIPTPSAGEDDVSGPPSDSSGEVVAPVVKRGGTA